MSELAPHSNSENFEHSQSTENMSYEADQQSNLLTPYGVASFMSESTSEDDWNSRCDRVKVANDGDYPQFWFSTVVSSGLLAETKSRW